MTARPRRTVLYMPGANARALEKAREINADGFIFDLEDAVSPDAKELARTQVCDAVRQGGYRGRELIIRVNGLDTPWGEDDVKAAVAVKPDALLLPKVESADEIRALAALIEQYGDLEKTAIWAMMETPRGILRAADIAAAHPRLECLVMGTSDLVKDLHAAHTSMRLPVLVSLGQCLLAARAEGLAILDGVYLDIQNDVGFHEACLQGKELGFDGKTLIHPRQVEAANKVFTPSSDDVEHAKRLIAAFDEAMAEGKAVALLDGKLIEILHVDEARRLVEMAKAIEEMEG
ncbi:MAG: CoA ester lyase [Sphingomonadales bacterium]